MTNIMKSRDAHLARGIMKRFLVNFRLKASGKLEAKFSVWVRGEGGHCDWEKEAVRGI